MKTNLGILITHLNRLVILFVFVLAIVYSVLARVMVGTIVQHEITQDTTSTEAGSPCLIDAPGLLRRESPNRFS